MADMTQTEITRAMTLLEPEDIAFLETLRAGGWVAANDGGVRGVFQTKAEAIEDILSAHGQERSKSKVKRTRKGKYSVRVLDPDEDPIERFYHEYDVARITPGNLLFYMELALVPLLPDWYFDSYTEEYKEFHKGD